MRIPKTPAPTPQAAESTVPRSIHLESCKSCGGKAEFKRYRDSAHPLNPFMVHVACTNCGCRTRAEAFEKAPKDNDPVYADVAALWHGPGRSKSGPNVANLRAQFLDEMRTRPFAEVLLDERWSNLLFLAEADDECGVADFQTPSPAQSAKARQLAAESAQNLPSRFASNETIVAHARRLHALLTIANVNPL